MIKIKAFWKNVRHMDTEVILQGGDWLLTLKGIFALFYSMQTGLFLEPSGTIS